ncbi:MAG: zinc ribbon domain-containing protein [Lachnospiraceae bacterium]|nr:zinc ribbon domain-containing protein [Lachnospiraceae bacterium]
MNCPFCGADLPEGSDFCPSCGQVITPEQSQSNQTGFNVNNAIFNGASNTSYQPAAPAPAKKSNSGSIIGIVVALLVVVAVGLFIFTNCKYIGNYKFYGMKMTYMGQTMTFTASDMGMSSDAAKLSVGLFNRATFDFNGDKSTGKLTVKGSDVTLEGSDGTLYGTFDKSEKTISINLPKDELAKTMSESDAAMLEYFDDIQLVFKK